MRKALGFAVLLALAAGCGAERRAAERPRTSLISELTLAPAYVTPAVWRYHPPEHARVTASRDLGDGRRLFVGRRGERWIYHERTRRLDAGSTLAPEDLIAILKLDSGGWAFVGASGTSYEARSPLGAFFRSSAPLDPLMSVAAAGRIIVGVKRDRSLLRSADAAASWQSVGPAKTGFIDVELTDKGQGLALAVPEALFSSTDEGSTWQPVAGVPKLGALSLERAEDGAIVIGTALGPRRFVPGDAQPLKPVVPDPADKKDPLGNPARGPSATAMVEGRALIAGSQYLELAPPLDRTGSWRLFKGPLDGKLEVSVIAELKGCRAVRLAAFDRFVTVACFRGAGENATQPVEFLRSESRGDDWHREPFTAEGSSASLRMAMGAAGSLIVTGICASGANGAGCGPLGVFHRRPARAESGAAKPAKAPRETAKAVHGGPSPNLELAASATPSLAEVAMALAFSPDGRYAYAVGRRTKTGAFAIFVSRDGGASFEAEDLGLVPTAADEESAEGRWERASTALRVESLSVAEDGALALVLTRRRAATLIVLDEEGRVVSTANAPDDRSMIGAAGMRALALAPGSRDVWESLDGGGSWNPLGRFPLELCKDEDNCYVPVRCAALGCAIGHEISRIGWGGQAEDEGGLLPPPAAYTPDFTEKRLRAPIACALDEGAWRPLAGVRSVPTAYEAGIGRAIWYAAAVDENSASVSVLEALAGSRRIETRSLLRPSPKPESLAMVALDQVEGVAALRYQIPEGREGESRLRNVEIGWANLLEGKIGQARIADGGPYASGDYTRGNGRAQRAAPGLLSIAEGGLYLRLHQVAGDKQDTWFVDGTSVATVPPLEWPAAIAKTGRSEMAHIGAAHVPLFLVAGGRAVVRADRTSGAWNFAATSTGLADPAKFGLVQDSTISYAGDRAGLHVEVFDPSSMTAEARIFPFRANGDAVDAGVTVPTQLSLADRPNRCGSTERQNTPRVVAPFRPGTRHAVIVSEGTEPPRTYLTVLAVLYGTPQSACAAVLDAEPAPADPPIAGRAERVILPVDDMEHAYLFRVGQSPGSELTRVEYRTMSCRFDPGAEVPPEVYRAPGTSIPRH